MTVEGAMEYLASPSSLSNSLRKGPKLCLRKSGAAGGATPEIYVK